MADRDAGKDTNGTGREGQGASPDDPAARDETTGRGGAGAGKEGANARTPRHSDEQGDSPPERPVRPDEEADQSVDRLEDPPQAEGDRD